MHRKKKDMLVQEQQLLKTIKRKILLSNMVVICEWCGLKNAIWKYRGKDNHPMYCADCRETEMIQYTGKICENPGCWKRAPFNFKGATRGKYCYTHSEEGMIDVTRRTCEYEDCEKIPSFGFAKDSKRRFCKDHAEEGMIDVAHKKCERKGCSKRPNFNFEGKKIGKYCREHSEVGMIDITNKRCERRGCLKGPLFNFEGETSGRFCKEHSEEGMINVVDRKCDRKGCLKVPSFNFEGETKGRFCKEHSEVGMINVTDKRCEIKGCLVRPSFNFEGETKGRFCKKHSEEGMTDVTNKRCAYGNCTKQPHFNFKGETKRLYCKEHSEKGMVDIVNKKCKQKGCNKQPTFNFEGEKSRMYCKQHSQEGMVDLSSRRCEYEGCLIRPTFNYEGEVRGRFCKKHAEKDMIVVTDQNRTCKIKNCTTRSSQGYLFSSPTRCAKHRLPNMLPMNMIKPLCEKCTNSAYWCLKGERYPTVCEDHAKLSTHTNIVEKECEGCKTPSIIPKDQNLCSMCSGEDTIKDTKHAKEIRVGEVLKTNNIKITSHDLIPEFACSKKRPDYVIDLGYQIIIIEIDEDQHKHNDKLCEITRMVQIYQDFGGAPVAFIRYNPDNYINHLGEKQPGKRENPIREKRLISLIKKLSVKPTESTTLPYLSGYYLYYDGDDSVDKRVILDYETTPRETLIKRIYRKG